MCFYLEREAGILIDCQVLPYSFNLAMLKIYNTLTRSKQEFIPRQPGKAGMYVCGMTVYDYCHIGHARVMVVFDTVARFYGIQVINYLCAQYHRYRRQDYPARQRQSGGI